jgi:large subunit ribosomal protein L35
MANTKQKTRKSAAKRFKVSKKGKVSYDHAGKRHNNEHKSADSISKKGRKAVISKTDVAKVAQMLPGVKVRSNT